MNFKEEAHDLEKGIIHQKQRVDISFDSKSPINHSENDIEKIEMEAIQRYKNKAENYYFENLKKVRSSLKEGGGEDLVEYQSSQSQSAKLKSKVKKKYKEDNKDSRKSQKQDKVNSSKGKDKSCKLQSSQISEQKTSKTSKTYKNISVQDKPDQDPTKRKKSIANTDRDDKKGSKAISKLKVKAKNSLHEIKKKIGQSSQSIDDDHQKEEEIMSNDSYNEAQVAKGNESSATIKSSKSTTSEEMEYEKTKEYQDKMYESIMKRLQLARQWVVIVMSYYLVKLAFTIIPRFSEFSTLIKNAIVMQSIGMLIVAIGLIYSYYVDLGIIKPLLYIQAIIMACSNFNEYNKGDLINYEGLNMISTLMSALFAMTNTYLASIVIVSKQAKAFMTLLVFGIEFSVIVFTNFKFNNMTAHAIKSLIICFVFLCIMIPNFHRINSALFDEFLDEAKNSYKERDMYKRMFDGLQEGIIVMNGDTIMFMNELSNKIVSHLYGFKNFFKKVNAKNQEVDIDRNEVKMFYLFQNNAQTGKAGNRKNKKSHTSSENNSKAVNSASSKEEKTEFSIREVMKMTTIELSSKVFTFEKRLVTNDITKMADEQKGNQQNLDNVIKNISAMKNIDEEYIPKFKFFQIKRSFIKSQDKKDNKVMICFIDISQKILYDTTKAEGEFLSLINSTISHEMRNPLNSIINQCKIIQSICLHFNKLLTEFAQYINPQIYQELSHIYQQVYKGNIISTASSSLLLLNVEDILGYAQLKAGKFIKNVKTFNIQRTVLDIVSIQEYQAESRNIQISTEFTGFRVKNINKGKYNQLQKSRVIDMKDQNLMIESDEKRIKQVLMNLQSNALKFTREGGKIQIICELVQANSKPNKKKTKSKSKIQRIFQESFSSGSKDSGASSDSVSHDTEASKFKKEHDIEAMFKPETKRDKLVISVIDSGIGIKPKDKLRLFKLFGCLSNTRQMNTQGIGLGLVISENIVKSFQGQIGVKSKFNKGSMFTFSIILGKDDDYLDNMNQDVVLDNANQDKYQNASGSGPADPSKTESARMIKQYTSDLAAIASGGSQNVFPNSGSRRSKNNLSSVDIRKTIIQKTSEIIQNEHDEQQGRDSTEFGNRESSPDDNAHIPGEHNKIKSNKVYKGPRGHLKSEIQKFNSMRTKSTIAPQIPKSNVSDVDTNMSADSNQKYSSKAQIGSKFTLTNSNYMNFEIKPLIQRENQRKAANVGKILIVDDEKFNCDIIEGFLMILGFQQRQELTKFAYNGEQAVKIIKKCIDEGNYYEYSLILMDCNMPFMDGYEATRRIRKMFLNMDIPRKEQPKIVAITGHVENEYVQRAINCGMDKVYSKPLPIREFGQLLMSMKFIDFVPEHLRCDEENQEEY